MIKMDKLNDESKTLILVNNINNTKKLKKYLKTNRKYTVVALTTEDQKKLERENIYCKTLSDYLTDKVLEEIRQNTRLWIKTWPKTKIDGKSFIELVSYSDTSLWWFTEHMMYNSVETSIKNIELVKHIIDKEKANEILIFGNGPLEEILHTFSGVEVKKIKEKRLNIKLELNLKNFAKKHPNIIWNLSRIYDLLKSIVAKTIVHRSHNSNHEFKRTILISTHNLNWRTVYDPIIKQPRTYDSFFDSIIKKLKKADYKLVTTFPLGYSTTHPWTSFVSGLKATIGRRKYGMPHKPFEYYLTIGIDKKANIQRRKLLKIWNELKNNEGFKNSMNYKDVNLWSLLRSNFLFFFSFIAGAAIKHIETASRMIDIEKPDLFLTGGGGDYVCELSLITQSKRNNIPTLEIQHGIIPYNTITYRHPKGWISYKMAVYGPYYKDLLTQANEFPPDSVVVTGQPRYDILAKADKIFSRERIFKKLNLTFDKKLLVWTTQTHGLSLAENEKNIYAVYNAVKSLKNVQLVIKLHPGEDQKAPLYRKDKSFKTIIVREEINTYELLKACDLMITRHSTTAMEAVALNKPVIILNLSGEPDPVGYVKEGVALGVYREGDLKPAIEKLLKDDSELAKNRKKYIEKYLYKIDEKASERVVKLIEGMINERQKKNES